jgi:hypothetical protein
MNPVTAKAFQDELAKIAFRFSRPDPATLAAELMKESAVPGMGIPGAAAVKKFGKGIAKNFVNTVEAAKTPVKSFKKGWHFGSEPGESGWMLGKGKVTKYLPLGPKALTVGSAALGAPDAFAKNDPSGQGRSKLERMSRWTGSNIGGIIGAPFGLTGAFAGGAMGEMAGAGAAKVVDRIRGYKPNRASPMLTPGVAE